MTITRNLLCSLALAGMIASVPAVAVAKAPKASAKSEVRVSSKTKKSQRAVDASGMIVGGVAAAAVVGGVIAASDDGNSGSP